MQNDKYEKWYEANQRYLMAAVDEVKNFLERNIARTNKSLKFEKKNWDRSANSNLANIAGQMSSPPTLESLCKIFGLSNFERMVLLLCAAVELDSQFDSFLASAQKDNAGSYPTFSLAMSVFPEPHWSALSPAAPLRYWRLIETGQGASLTKSPIRIDERILNYIAGVQHLDERLLEYIEPVDEAEEIVPSLQRIITGISNTWIKTRNHPVVPVIQLNGTEVASKRAIVTAACKKSGLKLFLIPAHFIPLDYNEVSALIRLLIRESVLSSGIVMLDCHGVETIDTIRIKSIRKLIESFKGGLIVSNRDPWNIENRAVISFEVGKPTAQEQMMLWKKELGQNTFGSNGKLESLVSQFSMNWQTIRAIGAKLRSDPGSNEINAIDSNDDLWEACRVQTRPRLDDLAQFIEPAASWDDLIIPQLEKQVLHDIAIHLRQRIKVYEQWGFIKKGKRGLGISALFAGPSGTGKTMAAEVLANELRLDLYRIDLSAVVSKYIGETEKNLRRVFDAAEDSGVILLFDEADALFGKRSEVKDSHDRYANIEVSYLLQRMEAYRGLAILTTNRKTALDNAFLRRIRFIVNFPFPDALQRHEIWKRIFPKDTPTRNLDLNRLAQLNVTGGNIRNIALNAAFLAAEKDNPVLMEHLLHAAKSEYAKIEKSLTESEIRGWV